MLTQRASLPAIAALSFLVGDAHARQTTSRVSLGDTGGQANSDSAFVSGVSSDGRYVAFVSAANNLVGGDTNGVQDVFVRNRAASTTVRVSVDSSGQQAATSSGSCAMSLDGRFVAFASRAGNLVVGDTNNADDVFVHDLLGGATTRVSVDALGAQANDHSRAPSLSGDGRYVAFVSRATNLVAGDTNGVWDAFVHDRSTGAIERVSVDSSSNQGDGDALLPSISAGGRCVTFTSAASNLIALDTNGVMDVFVHDRIDGTTVRVSVDSAGAEASLGGQKSSLSADGRYVVFESFSDDLVAGDTNSATDVFVYDRVQRAVERVSLDSFGGEANSISSAGALSADGRFVTFSSLATNLVAADTNSAQDAFVHDRATGQTRLASVATSGVQSDRASSGGAVCGDGRLVVFSSYGTNLVAGDTNGAQDVFMLDVGPIPATGPTIYCTAGTTTNGCTASIGASANPSLSLATACVLDVSGVEGQKSGLIFYGTNNACFLPLAWGAGTSFLCAQAPLQRTPLQDSGGSANACDGSIALDWNAFQQAHPAALGQPWSAGARVFAQAWFRDPPSAKTTNLSDALELTYVP